jgi:ribonucleoside-diphosphate reductase alpha chain
MEKLIAANCAMIYGHGDNLSGQKRQHVASILKSQIETGTPYLCYKDAANTKSNQKNLGTIKSSNLCSEIIEYSDDTSYAVCNLASIALPAFVRPDGTFDFEKLHRISQTITRNLNKVIDRTFYPVPETKTSNLKHRPIGLGVQGLADVYALMRCAFDSPEAAALNREIFETIYHGAVTASVAIARRRAELMDELAELEKITGVQNDGTRETALNTYMRFIPEESVIFRSLDSDVKQYRGAYSSFIGSPAWHGLLQFDLWDRKPESDVAGTRASGRWDWAALKAELKAYGMRNSLLLAPMPTASTSQILGNTECFEPITSNIFQRQTLAGEFTIINKHLVKDLLALGLWNVDMKNRILSGGGSVQHIDEIPNDIKVLYKTAWELKQKVLIDQAADRGIYVCQSQSLNLFVAEPSYSKISSMHFYAWKKGLKTGCYYLRTKAVAKAQQFTVEPCLTCTA